MDAFAKRFIFIAKTHIPMFLGIIRDSSCKYIPEWQSYRCFGMEYAMMVIESLDSDTETRRLSPVAVASSGYVDLINGRCSVSTNRGYSKHLLLITSLETSHKLFIHKTSKHQDYFGSHL